MQTNEEIRKEWEESEVSKRVTSSELCAINHHFPEWNGETISEWWLQKLQEQKQQMIEKGERLKIKENLPAVTDYQARRHNKVITDYQNLIKE